MTVYLAPYAYLNPLIEKHGITLLQFPENKCYEETTIFLHLYNQLKEKNLSENELKEIFQVIFDRYKPHQTTLTEIVKLAITDKQNTILKVLLACGALHNYHHFPTTPPILHLTVAQINETALGLLLSCGVDVNMRDEQDRTALHLAVQQGSQELVCKLVEGKADVNAKINKGYFPSYVPLDWSLVLDHREVSEILLRAGADPSKLFMKSLQDRALVIKSKITKC